MWSCRGWETGRRICPSPALRFCPPWCPVGPGWYFALVEDAPLTLLGSSLQWAGVVSTEGGEDFLEKEPATQAQVLDLGTHVD